MALFEFYNFEKPGPGVNPGEPRKTGIRRVTELLGRDGANLFKAGFLSFLSFLPWYYGVTASIQTHTLLVMLLSGILGGMIAAPQLVGVADTALRALRDEPGIWWLTYKSAWKRNWKASLLPGACMGGLIAAFVFALAHLNFGAVRPMTLVLFLLCAWFLLGMLTYLVPQIALFDMGPKAIVINSILLQLKNPLRTLGAVAIQFAYWAAFLLFYPFSPVILPITGLWLPLFLALCVVYAPMEKAFDLENLVRQAQSQK